MDGRPSSFRSRFTPSLEWSIMWDAFCFLYQRPKIKDQLSLFQLGDPASQCPRQDDLWKLVQKTDDYKKANGDYVSIFHLDTDWNYLRNCETKKRNMCIETFQLEITQFLRNCELEFFYHVQLGFIDDWSSMQIFSQQFHCWFGAKQKVYCPNTSILRYSKWNDAVMKDQRSTTPLQTQQTLQYLRDAIGVDDKAITFENVYKIWDNMLIEVGVASALANRRRPILAFSAFPELI